MNWYKQHKLAMPLPKVKNQYPSTVERNIGLQYLDDHLSEEHAQELSEDGMSYLGAGFYGTAFQFDNNNMVKKLTKDKVEAETAQEIIKRQNGDKALPGLVYVYEVKDLSDKSIEYRKTKLINDEEMYENEHKLFQITMEKIQPLSKIQTGIFYNYFDALYRLKKSYPDFTNHKIILTLRAQVSVNLDQDKMMFLNTILDFIKILIENNYRKRDIHQDNVGIRKNEIIILDLGSIKFES